MGVRQLAGPFVFKDLETGEIPTSMGVYTWWPGVGLIVKANFSKKNSYDVNVATLDGYCAQVMGRSAAAYFHYWNWWPEQKKMVGLYGTKEYVVEPLTFMTQQTHPDDQPTEWANFFYRYVRLPDRRIYYYNHRMYRQVNGVKIDVPESAPFLQSSFFGAEVFPGRNTSEVLVSDTYLGQAACFYNTASQKVSSPVYYFGVPCRRIVYAPEYGVFVTEHLEVVTPPPDPEDPDRKLYTLRVWSLEVEPTLLTPVTVVTGSSKVGQVVTYGTRLTGAQNDPAYGELINWTLAGTGTLLDPQTATNTEGLATTRVQYQFGDIGPSVVTASVEC
jgi:hypothetical protein